MVMNPDHPDYSDQAYERDPTRECPHGVPYPTPCADCESDDAQDREEESGTGFLMVVEPDEEADHA
jgi:hypothetical protein